MVYINVDRRRTSFSLSSVEILFFFFCQSMSIKVDWLIIDTPLNCIYLFYYLILMLLYKKLGRIGNKPHSCLFTICVPTIQTSFRTTSLVVLYKYKYSGDCNNGNYYKIYSLLNCNIFFFLKILIWSKYYEDTKELYHYYYPYRKSLNIFTIQFTHFFK